MAELDFRMGDARLKLKEDTDRKYSLLLVDAFSSDAIPMHLLTAEAFDIYFSKLKPGGSVVALAAASGESPPKRTASAGGGSAARAGAGTVHRPLAMTRRSPGRRW